MNKIEKLNESIRTLFRGEGEKFCYTPGEIERLVCSLNYKQLYSVLRDMAEPVFACCAGGGICDSHQYHSTKLFPANATLIWSDEGEPLGDDNISTSYSNELWLLEDMTIAAVSCFRVLNSAASYITEYREYKGDEWPAHLVPVNILELWQSLIDKYQDCGDEELDAALKAIIYEPSHAMIYLKAHDLFTLEDLDTALQDVNASAKAISADMKKASARMKVITGIQNAVADCQTHKAVHDKYLKIGWKARQAIFAETHKDELDSFNKAYRYLKKQGVDLNVDLKALQAEYDRLQATHTELAGQLAAVKEELQPMKDIRYWVGKVLTPEQSEVEKKPEPKYSIKERLRYIEEQKHSEPEPKAPQHKKKNMEL